MTDSNEIRESLQWVRRLAQTLNDHELYSLKMETEDTSVFLRAKVKPRQEEPPRTAVVGESEEDEVEEKDVSLLTAQDVGVFRATVPLETGALIEKGQRFGLVESVSMQHDLIADRSGYLLEVLTNDGDPVEFGQPLLVLAAQEEAAHV